MTNTNNMIKKKLDRILRENYPVYSFVEQLSQVSELIFFGGAIRDLYLFNEIKKPRDLDIVLIPKRDKDIIESLIKQYDYKKNRFDGYKLNISDVEIDLWFLENTWAFRENKIKTSKENLINSVYLSVDGIAYNYNYEELYDDVFKNTKSNRLIDIVLEDNPQEELNLVRSLIFKNKYNFNFSERLNNKFAEYLKNDSFFNQKLYEVQLEHYKVEKMSYSRIKQETDEILLMLN